MIEVPPKIKWVFFSLCKGLIYQAHLNYFYFLQGGFDESNPYRKEKRDNLFLFTTARQKVLGFRLRSPLRLGEEPCPLSLQTFSCGLLMSISHRFFALKSSPLGNNLLSPV